MFTMSHDCNLSTVSITNLALFVLATCILPTHDYLFFCIHYCTAFLLLYLCSPYNYMQCVAFLTYFKTHPNREVSSKHKYHNYHDKVKALFYTTSTATIKCIFNLVIKIVSVHQNSISHILQLTLQSIVYTYTI